MDPSAMDNELKTIPQILSDGRVRWPEKLALSFAGVGYGFADLDRLSNRIARGFLSIGAKQGDRICSMLDNSIDQALVWFATVKLGAISVPLNTALKGEFLRHQITDSGASIMVAEGHYVDRVISIEGELPELKTLVVREPAAEHLHVAGSRLEILPLGTLDSGDDASILVEIAPSDLALIIYTSGTTGPSKGCMISHGYACHAGLRFAQGATITGEDKFWTPLPMFHMGAAGFTLGCLQLGASATIYQSFSVSNFWSEIERSGATVACIISNMLVLIAEAPDSEGALRCHGQLRAVAGVPFPRALQDRWKQRFGVRHTGASGFGMTEATPMTFSPVTEAVPDDCSGRRYADFDVQIVDDEDNILPAGMSGELVARPQRSGNMFQGYWKRPEATLAAFRNLWFHTGDIGRFDEDGFFFFVDRKKDYLRHGGENISSYELEMAVRAHPEIEDVAAHAAGVPGSEDEVMISVVRREGSQLGAEALCRWSIDRLPRHAVPRFIAFCDVLPRNASGRILKYELRERGVSRDTWDRATSAIAIKRRNASGH